MEKEIWKDVLGYEGLYKISSLGRVLSTKRKTTKGGIIKSFLNSKGYKTLVLCKEGKTKRKTIHRLICEAFLKNPENKEHINHKDGVRSNSVLSNLEWCTRSENEKHKYSHLGVIPYWKGKIYSDSIRSKKLYQYDLNMNFIKEWDCAKRASEHLGLKRSNICKVCKGIRKHTGGFIFKN